MQLADSLFRPRASRKVRWGAVTLLTTFVTGTASAQFTDVAVSSGTNNTGGAAGVTWIDYDNDGLLDLYVNGAGALYRNLGNGTFSAPISLSGSRQAVWADYDNDGDLDLKVTGALYRNQGNGTFTADIDSSIGITGPSNEEGQAWIDYDRDGLIDLFIPDGSSGNFMFRNQGNGTFVSLGFNPIGLTPNGNGDFMAVGDYDGDGNVDMLYRISTGNTPLWKNNGNGTFTESLASAGIVFTAGNSFKSGLAFGDYDNDGDLDLYVGVYGGSNVLFKNNGNGTFTDVTSSAGAGGGTNTRGVAWGDYDNDGDLDLYVGNDGGANNLLQNNGDGTFTDIAVAQGVADASATKGVAFGDFDNDGDLDIYVNNNNQANRLYRNDLNDGRRLRVKVTGAGAGFSSLDAIGARVSLFDAAGSTLLAVREINGGRGFGSQDPLMVHFGLDPLQTYTVKVKYVSGIETMRSSVVPQSESMTMGSTVLDNTIEMVEGVGISVVESGGSTNLSEAGPTSDTYTVVLDSLPAANVTINIAPDVQTDLGAGAGVSINLIFTTANWNGSQTVTVTAVDDAVAEGAHTSTVTHTAGSVDANYDGIAILDVTANITDDDTAGVTIAESAGSTDVNEAGPTSDTYTLALDSEPTADVTVNVDPDAQTDLGAGAGASISLIFTAADWNVLQTVTVAAVDDAVIEGPHASTLTHSVLSSDSNYNGISVVGVAANISDNDAAGVTIVESGGSTDVSETGPTSDTYTLALTAQPAADVTLIAQSDAQLDLGFGPGVAIALTFTPTDWSIPRMVMTTALDDGTAEGPHTATITHSTLSSDANFNGLSAAGVTANITDNDSAGVTIVQSGGSTDVSETGPTSDTYTLVLNAQPTADVTLTAQPDAQLDLGFGVGISAVFTFTSTDWNVPRVVVVTALDDGIGEGPHVGTITHSADSADSGYQGLAIANTIINIVDNDLVGVTITESGGSSVVNEAGPTSDTYTLELDAQPTADVTVTAQPDAQLDLGFGAGIAVAFTFTPTDWNIPRVMVVTAVDDDAVEGPHVAAITHAAGSADAGYDGIVIPAVTVNISDNDAAVDSGDIPADNVPADNVPADNVPTDNAPTGNAPVDNAPADDPAETLVAIAGVEQETFVGEATVFDGSESYGASGSEIVRYSWDFDINDGIGEDAVGRVVEWSFEKRGIYLVSLTITDDQGAHAHDSIVCTVFNDDILELAPPACGPLCGPLGLVNMTLLLAGMGMATRPGRAAFRTAARMLTDWLGDARRGRTCDAGTLGERRHARWSWERNVIVRLAGRREPLRVPSADVSEGGLRLWLPEALSIGRILELGDGVRDTWLQGRVIHVAAEPNEQGLYATGIQFVENQTPRASNPANDESAE